MAYTRLTMTEREEISRTLAEDPTVTWTELGRRLGRHRTTLQRETRRNGGRLRYRARDAEARAQRERPRRRHRLACDPALAERVRAHLRSGYSPAGTARLLGGIAAETIYQGIYRGHLDVKATDVLRTRRHRRRCRSERQNRPGTHVLGHFTPIHQRPQGVEDRTEFGHWEGDLIIGARNRSALITLIERVSRAQVVLNLPGGYKAPEVCERLDGWVATKPARELISITWDRGSEMADWRFLTVAWDLDIYFADPHSPWQRGANENANRQLRYWLPKGTDLTAHTQDHLDQICHLLNTQPRRSLNWATANHTYAALAAH